MTDLTLGSEEATGPNFGVTVDDGFPPHDYRPADYRLGTDDRTYSNMNRPDYASYFPAQKWIAKSLNQNRA